MQLYIFSPKILLFIFSLTVMCNTLNAQDKSHVDSLIVAHTLDSLWNTFDDYFLKKEFEKAISILEKRINLAETNNLLEQSASDRFFIAYCYFQKKDDDSLFLKLELLEEYCTANQLPETSFVYSDLYYLYGKYHYKKGNFENALYYYKQTAKQIKEQDFSFRKDDLYHNIALVFSKHGDYAGAENYYKQALNELYKGDFESWEEAQRQQNIARNYLKWGKMPLAFKYYKMALNILSKEDSPNIKSLIYNNLGEYYIAQMKYDSAHYYLNKASDFGLKGNKLIKNLQERGRVEIEEGNFTKAKNYLQQALQQSYDYHGEHHPETAKLLSHIGDIYISKLETEKGLSYYQKAINTLSKTFQNATSVDAVNFQEVTSKVYLFQTLIKKAKAQKTLNQLSHALETYEYAAKVIEVLLSKYIITEASKSFWLVQTKPVYEEIIKLALILEKTELAWKYSQKGHAVLLMQSVQNLEAQKIGNVPDSLINRERKLKISIAAWENEVQILKRKPTLNTTEQSAIPFLEQDIFQYEEILASLHQFVEENYPIYYKIKYNLAFCSFQGLQERNLLNRETALIEYFVGEQTLYIFVVTNSNIQAYQKTLNASFLKNINIYYSTIKSSSRSATNFGYFCQSAYSLYQILLAEPLEDLPFYIINLIIIPDEQLNYLSFAAFLTKPVNTKMVNYYGLDYLVNDYNLSYTYSSKLLEHNHLESPLHQKKLLSVAPDFEGNLDSLLWNIEEVIFIDSIIPGKALVRSTATLDAFIKNVPHYKIAHLATHAYCNDSLPLSSSIYFYRDSLPIYEIYNLEQALELIVLSACETGNGQLRKGEGIISLAHAFMQSGSRSIVTSLWLVNDEQTPKLMKHFYKYLKAGDAKNIALSKAQRTYMEEANGASYSHPYYWATFIQIGKTDAIFINVFYYYFCLAIASIFLLLFFFYIYKIKKE